MEKKFKPIQSFVRRERKLSKHTFPEDFLAQYEIPPGPFIKISHYFPFSEKITLDIGFGTGDALFTQAQLNPEQGYIGIEVYQTGINKILYKLKQSPLDNLKILRGDAVNLLSTCISSQSIDNIQILFPDPWPKKRHHKRRLIQTGFVKCLYHALKIQGTLYLGTDWEEYAQHMLHTLETSSFINSTGAYQFSKRPTMLPLTKFEQRGHNLDHPIFYLVFNKCL